MRLTRILALLALLAATSCGDATFGTTTETPNDPPAFTKCGEIECAVISVPVDRSDSALGTISLGVYRRRGSAAQTQPLFVHPGGPGADVKELVGTVNQFLGTEAENFDVIGLATRATPDVTPAQCTDSLDDFVAAVHDDDAASRIAAGCLARSKALVGHAGTLDAVDDLEQLRTSLGLQQVDFLGWSYGAMVGATWAMLHPGSLRAVVLDGPMDPALPWSGQFRAVLDAQQANMSAFLDECAGETSCALGRRPLTQLRRIASGLSEADAWAHDPTHMVLSLGIAAELAMYDADMGKFADTAVALSNGDDTSVRAAVDARLGRNSTGKDDGGMEAQVVVRCSDVPRAEAARAVTVAASFTPPTIHVGLGAALERVCGHLPEPARPLGTVTPVAAAQDANVLVVSTRLDAAVPSAVSSALASRMGWGHVPVDAAVHLAVGFDKAATVVAVGCLLRTICH